MKPSNMENTGVASGSFIIILILEKKSYRLYVTIDQLFSRAKKLSLNNARGIFLKVKHFLQHMENLIHCLRSFHPSLSFSFLRAAE